MNTAERKPCLFWVEMMNGSSVPVSAATFSVEPSGSLVFYQGTPGDHWPFMAYSFGMWKSVVQAPEETASAGPEASQL